MIIIIIQHLLKLSLLYLCFRGNGYMVLLSLLLSFVLYRAGCACSRHCKFGIDVRHILPSYFSFSVVGSRNSFIIQQVKVPPVLFPSHVSFPRLFHCIADLLT